MHFRLWLENQSVPPQFIGHDGMVTLYRFSQANRGPEYLIDPDKSAQNRQPYSNREYRVAQTPRTFFYLSPSSKEPYVGNFLYTAQFPAKGIYNLLTDPLNIKDQSQQANNGAMNFDDIMQRVKQLGFQGIYYNPGFDVVNLFVPVKGKLAQQQVAAA